MRSRNSKKKWLNFLPELFKLIVKQEGMIYGKFHMMKCREVKYYLNDYLEGKLIDEMRKEISLHLKKCHSCRKRSEELKLSLKSSGILRSRIHQTGGFWEGISEPNEYDSEYNLPAILYSPLKRKDDPAYRLAKRKRLIHSKWMAIGAPVSAILLAVIISVLYFIKTNPAFSVVESLKGEPVAGNLKINNSGVLAQGEWLETDTHSSARLKAAGIGEVDIDPGSTLQLLDTKDKDYRIYLKQGKINTKIWNPINLISVVTPSATFAGAGSACTIEVDKTGSSFLQVQNGRVIIKSGKNKEIVPAGTVCETMKNKGPGTPYFLNTSTEFKAALSRFDFGGRSHDDLEIILKNSTRKDALSLWYLLRKAEPGDLKLIYDRLSELEAPPDGVTIDGIISGNETMLYMWWEKLGYGKKSLWENIKG